jgi:hypothetical protein
VRYKRNTGLELSPRDEKHLICINRWASFATQSTFCRWSRTANDVAVLRLLVELVKRRIIGATGVRAAKCSGGEMNPSLQATLDLTFWGSWVSAENANPYNKGTRFL